MSKYAKPEKRPAKTATPEESSGRRRSNANPKLTISDIARLANVSKKTISRVINHSGLVRDETRDKIMQIVATPGYAPDPPARALPPRRPSPPASSPTPPDSHHVAHLPR